MSESEGPSHAHVVGRDGREGRQTYKWKWGTHLCVVAHADLRFLSLAHYNSSRPSCPVVLEGARDGIDGPVSRALGSLCRTKFRVAENVGSCARLKAS